MEIEYDNYLEDVEATTGSAFQANTVVQDETLTVLKDIAKNVSNDRTHLAISPKKTQRSQPYPKLSKKLSPPLKHS